MRKSDLSRPPSYPERLRDLASFVALLWAIELIDRFFFSHSLQNHGIHPRTFSHFEGLLFAPFLHANWNHLIGNSLSLLILGAIILGTSWRDLATVSLAAAVTGGLVVWLIGKSGTNHIGASSLVFGYLAFLLASGFYRPSPGTIVIALLILFFYGSSLFGILPTSSVRAAGISWEGHLGGGIGGFLVARSRKKKLRGVAFPSDLSAP